ncbi:MAG TPA: iron export ABC transporter permease subunit FetB [Armatimonadota bacterium]|jgi:putative ABC transport system permease protein
MLNSGIQQYAQISFEQLAVALVLIAVTVVLSRIEKLGLEKELMIGTVRAFVQLMAVGYVLKAVFEARSPYWVFLALAAMTAVAGYTAAQRSTDIPQAKWIAILSVGIGGLGTLAVLVGLGIISSAPRYVIPISGMLLGNSMNGAALAMNRVSSEIKLRRAQIEAALSLGATSRQAADPALKAAATAAMIPNINSMMTVGIVSLPGMMSGQIIAGQSPTEAVRYQIVVLYMITAAVTVASLAAALWSYRRFFTKDHQLKSED